MNDIKFEAQSILFGYYIKFNKLMELTDTTFGRDEKYSKSNTVDIYIDLYNMMLPLYRSDIYSSKQKVVTASIINLAAHMRDYYWSRHRVNTRIYLIYADDTTFNHRQFYANFGNEKHKEALNYDRMNEIIESQLSLVKIICGYLYGIYYVRRSSDFTMFTFDEICKNPNTPSIVLTKSSYAYQLPALCDNCVLFRPQKFKGDDTSYAITNADGVMRYCDKVTNQKALENMTKLNSGLLSLVMALTKLSSKNVLSLFNTSTAINKIYDAIKNNKILNGYNSDIDYVYNNLDISNKIDPVTFKYRFNAIDLAFQHRLYINSAESKDMSHLIDLEDRNAVHYINNKYFQDNPLNLEVL